MDLVAGSSDESRPDSIDGGPEQAATRRAPAARQTHGFGPTITRAGENSKLGSVLIGQFVTRVGECRGALDERGTILVAHLAGDRTELVDAQVD